MLVIIRQSLKRYCERGRSLVRTEQLIQKLKDFLPPNALLLEIGSGPGTDFQILKKDYKVVGSDFSDEFLNRLINNNIEDDFSYFDEETYTLNAHYSNKKFQIGDKVKIKVVRADLVKRQLDFILISD